MWLCRVHYRFICRLVPCASIRESQKIELFSALPIKVISVGAGESKRETKMGLSPAEHTRRSHTHMHVHSGHNMKDVVVYGSAPNDICEIIIQLQH